MGLECRLVLGEKLEHVDRKFEFKTVVKRVDLGLNVIKLCELFRHLIELLLHHVVMVHDTLMFFGNRLHLIIPLLCIKPNLLHIDTNRLQTARQMLHHLLN